MACFHKEGNYPVTIEVFSIHVRYVMITGKDSFEKRSGMPSQPYEEVFLKCFITRIYSVTVCGFRSKHAAGWKVSLISVDLFYIIIIWQIALWFLKSLFPNISKKVLKLLTLVFTSSASPADSGHALFVVGSVSWFSVLQVAAVYPFSA